MDTHIKVVGWLWIVSGVLGLLGGLCAGFFIASGGIMSGEQEALLATSLVSLCVGGGIFLGAVLNIIAGWGVLRYENWGRILVIILAILNLLAFPIGTALGIYTLWAMFNDESRALFGV